MKISSYCLVILIKFTKFTSIFHMVREGKGKREKGKGRGREKERLFNIFFSPFPHQPSSDGPRLPHSANVSTNYFGETFFGDLQIIFHKSSFCSVVV